MELSNTDLRYRMNTMFEKYCQPNKRIVSETIKVSYADFCRWVRDKQNFSQATLRKIERFLDERGC